ncbi:glycosyltransferase family 2 [Clostridium sp. CAG:411]|mgnify:FL=1|jgi:glycosyltransferase involved in cell wall biosynthesis|nr:glycosyltransferase family 2 protein [Lachnospiraceae bacterium]CDE45562.1 glycosyltransferase family 2 [Clostridium sp. CAG:411]
MEAMITILTPTYNRRRELQKLYDSLKRQINKSFIWYIVDDGSTDGTDKTVKSFQRENCVPIQYKKKKNGGKHTALNLAIPDIETELTMIVDSDDCLTADATQTIFEDWLKNCESNIAGMVYLRGYSGFEVIGDMWPYEEQFGNCITHTWNKGIKGDKAEVYRTDILKQYPFPVFRREKFLSEACVWIEIAKTHNVFMKNKIIYIGEYLPDGLTRSGRKMQMQNPKGAMCNAKAYMWRTFCLKIKMKNAILYNCYGLQARKSLGELWKESPNRLLTTLGLLPGMVLRKKWRKYGKRRRFER